MLGRVRPDGSPLISAADLKEGVVTFEDEGDAERFAGLLEADGDPQVRRVKGEGFQGWVGARGSRLEVEVHRRYKFEGQILLEKTFFPVRWEGPILETLGMLGLAWCCFGDWGGSYACAAALHMSAERLNKPRAPQQTPYVQPPLYSRL